MQRLIITYKTWHEYVRNFPKDFRYTLGGRIDSLFLEIIEAAFSASVSIKEQKLSHIRKASLKLDVLKFFLQVAWEGKALDSKKYIVMSQRLAEIGRMLGGWQKQVMGIKKETPQNDAGNEM